MNTHRHNVDAVAYAETLINSKSEIVTMSGRDAAGLKIGLKKAPVVIIEAIEDYKKDLSEQTNPAIVKFIETEIARLENILK